ncbi:RNB domain-containing ribonuclease, partial [Pseudomonas aeruginosa]|uniref:RNB domain-containing ribonuclease n=1 Tax=Pseudomonas aeruginosa TaxID=287 RepID=UPI0031B6C5BD
WPQAVEQQVAGLKEEVPEVAKAGRVDLRDLPLVTIDGEDARDFDDAVYCEKKRGGGWRLWVAIADVSYYVRPPTPLDREARNRGTSVYFPSQVIPMLPEVLSNGLCSLNPQVDRLCMVCEMTVSSKGR